MTLSRLAVVAIALLVAVSGVLLSPARGTLAGHEPMCFNAYLAFMNGEGIYANLIVGAGEIDGANANDLIIGSAGPDDIDGGNGNDRLIGDVCDRCDEIPGAGPNGAPGNDIIEGRIGNDTLIGGNPGGDGDEIDLCNGESGTDTAIRCDIIIKVP